jgi:GTPase SAR1 family protein
MLAVDINLYDRYLRGTHGVVLVYDVTNPVSLESLAMWMREVKSRVPPGCVIAIIGTKVDRAEERAVPQHVAQAFAGCTNKVISTISALLQLFILSAECHGAIYLEVSSRDFTSEQIEQLLTPLTTGAQCRG